MSENEHTTDTHGDHKTGWWWTCTCGAGSPKPLGEKGAPTRNASAHLRGVRRKAAAAAVAA